MTNDQVDAAAPAPASDFHDKSLVQKLRRRERWLLALAAVRSELLSGANVNDALDLIAERSAALAEADATLVLLRGGSGDLQVHAAIGALDALGPLMVGKRGQPVASADEAWSVAIGDAVGVYDTANLPAPENAALAALWNVARSVLVAPIPPGINDGGVVICLRAAHSGPFDPDQQPELVGLAEQASIALEVVHGQEQRRSDELMADRERIARDLHDHVIQRLFAVGLSLQSCMSKISEPPVRDRVDQAVQDVDEAIAELRSSIFDLRVEVGQRKNLRLRLKDIVLGVGADGPNVALRCNGPIDTVVPPQLAEQTEAVVREAVSNAIRHSAGSAVTVTVTVTDHLEIIVADNGCGIGDDAAYSGLNNLAARASDCGGAMTIDASDHGTTLRWAAPIPAEEEPKALV